MLEDALVQSAPCSESLNMLRNKYTRPRATKTAVNAVIARLTQSVDMAPNDVRYT